MDSTLISTSLGITLIRTKTEIIHTFKCPHCPDGEAEFHEPEPWKTATSNCGFCGVGFGVVNHPGKGFLLSDGHPAGYVTGVSLVSIGKLTERNYALIRSLYDPSKTFEENQDHKKYRFEESSCPINYIRVAGLYSYDEEFSQLDADPHHLLKHIGTVTLKEINELLKPLGSRFTEWSNEDSDIADICNHIAAKVGFSLKTGQFKTLGEDAC